MNQIAICTDSSSLLTELQAASLNVDLVPVGVILGGEPFDESASPLDGFYKRLRDGVVATTAQPSPAALADAYERAASRGAESVVSIHLDSRVSGTVSSAEIAARDARLPVHVVDTRTVSFGVGACVRAAAGVADRGGSADDAAREAARLGSLMRNVFVARGGPGGRVPADQSWTVLSFARGATSPIRQCSSVAEAAAEMAAVIRDDERQVSAAVGHAGPEMEAVAGELAEELARSPGVLAVERYRVGAPVGAHTGPESFGVFWWPTR